MSGPPRWPKGPFPEKYRARAIHDRLAAAWTVEPGVHALDRARELGLAPHPRHADPYVRLFTSPSTEATDTLRGLPGVTAFHWAFGTRDDTLRADEGPLVGLVPTADAVEALVVVGTSGPTHGIGSAAVARFLTTLRSFSRYRVEVLGEERIELAITPRDEAAAALIAERMRHVCPPLARLHPTDAAPIVSELMGGRFVMDWR